MCHLYGEVRIKSLASGCLFHYFLNHFVYVCVLVDLRCHHLYSVLEKNCIICFYSVKLRQDVTWHSKSRALSSLQLTLPTHVIPSLTLICVSRHVLYNISSHFFFPHRLTLWWVCARIFFTVQIKVVERYSQTTIFSLWASWACELLFRDSHN